MESTLIYIATHKKTEIPKNHIYQPIRVGAKLSNDDFGYLRDDSGCNISEKNKSYCELTALFWMWKNDTSDIIGLSHYRRYFFKSGWSASFENLLTEKDIREKLKKADIILPEPIYIFKDTVEKNYEKYHNIEDLNLCRKYIQKKFPEYMEAFETVMSMHCIYGFNMFICYKKDFDKYCQWLFSILDYVEQNIDTSSYNDYQKRVYGFIAERLLIVWVVHHNMRISEAVVLNTDGKGYNPSNHRIIWNIRKWVTKFLNSGE